MSQAKTACADRGMRLPTVKNAQENQSLLQGMAAGECQAVWLGLVGEGSWVGGARVDYVNWGELSAEESIGEEVMTSDG